MATAKANFAPHVTTFTVAGTKEAYAGVSSLFDQMGCAKTADTGQLDIPGIVSAPAAGAFSGYEIRSWNDGYSTVFLKVEYGAGGTTPIQRLRLRLTLGTGSDGAGTITGIVFTNQVGVSTSGATGGARWQHGCRANGAIWMVLENTGFHHLAFVIDRRRDIDGNVILGDWMMFHTYESGGSSLGTSWATYKTPTGLVQQIASTTSNPQVQHLPYSSGGTAVTGSSGMFSDETITADAHRCFSAWPEPAIQPNIVYMWATETEGGISDPTLKYVIKAKQWGAIRTYLTAIPGGYMAWIRSTSMVTGLIWE